LCSIIGYMGTRDAAPLLVKALRRMEYRGYDSAGIATVCDSKIIMSKGVGKVDQVNASNQLEQLPGKTGIGHTRWATHGGVNEANAHPHLSSSGRIAIVHNGIIENYEELKAEVGQRGYIFKSETDSEVIANVLQCNRDLGMTVEEAVSETLRELKGRYAFVAMMDDGTLVGARNHAPLIIGVGRHGIFVSSDILGFVEDADDVIYLDNGQIVTISPTMLRLSDFRGSPVKQSVVKVSKELGDSEKGEFVHHTLKEIHDQPLVITKAGRKHYQELSTLASKIKRAKAVYITGSGSSYNAALVGKYLFSQNTDIRMEAIISSEARFSPMSLDKNSLLVALSQSGESADVLDAVGMKKYAEATGDPDVFDANAPALEACLCAIESRQDSHGFVSGMDWRGGMFYNSRRFALSNQVMLVRMFKLLRMREEAEDLRSNIRKVFFSPARGYYADTVWWQLGEVKKDYTFDSFGNALAILEDVSTKSARRVASHFRPGRTQFGQRNIWPPHRSSVARAMATIRGVEALATDRAFLANTPNSYQNASIWPFVELAVIRSLLKLGLVDDANGLLEMMLNRKGVSEWYDPWTGEPRGTPDQLMSAAAIVDACKTLGLD
jgi:hypothetical protein